MNRFRLILAYVLGLAALSLSAQQVKIDLPATKGNSDSAATPAPSTTSSANATPTPAKTFTEPQILEELGWFVGRQVGLSELGFTKEQTSYIVKGLLAASAGQDSPYDPDEIGPQLETFMQGKKDAFMAKLRDQNHAEAKTFFAELQQKDKNVVELPSGLRYEIIQPGNGPYPKATDTVKVDYTGRLLDGTVFDSSAQHGKPAVFELDKVIPGWRQGIEKINKGGKIRLYIPSDLAYGDAGKGPIPPGAALIFDVQLLDINPPAAAADATSSKQ